MEDSPKGDLPLRFLNLQTLTGTGRLANLYPRLRRNRRNRHRLLRRIQ